MRPVKDEVRRLRDRLDAIDPKGGPFPEISRAVALGWLVWDSGEMDYRPTPEFLRLAKGDPELRARINELWPSLREDYPHA